MKQSVVYGRRIFDDIQSLTEDINNIDHALSMLGGSISEDRNTLAHKILREKRDEQRKELNKLLNRRYVIYQEKEEGVF